MFSIFIVYEYLCPFYTLFTKEMPFSATCCADSEWMLYRWEMGRKELCDLQQSCLNIIIHFLQRMVMLYTVRPPQCYVMLCHVKRSHFTWGQTLYVTETFVCVSFEEIYTMYFCPSEWWPHFPPPFNYNSNFLTTIYYNRFVQYKSPTI
jgi:hypothetical protein